MPTDTSAAAPYEGRVDTHRFDIGIARALIEDASRVDSLPLLTCRFRPDGKVSRCVRRRLPRSFSVCLSPVKALEARFHGCVCGCAQRVSPCECLGVTQVRDDTHLVTAWLM